ncbi:hypothetical protein BON30_28440 [Cystobacter ferrugineus]|uniref:DUF7738 domain-containing protein n=2 Tax=Cystobacter ferrugineus TaxID=83449 RepID=A0A1L9B4R4_9BACT|nr:hypothetical protein BON30_28440 [Cystobacter ferrugineus]
MGVLLLLLGGCREPAPAPAPGTPENPLLTVEGTTVRYNGQLLPWEDTGGWRRVLGPPSRESDGILTWDELGLFLYDRDSKVPGPEAFEVLLGRARLSPQSRGEPESWPRKNFTARLLVDGAAITNRSTLGEINRDKKGTSFTRGYMNGIYKYSVGEFDVWLEYGHDRSLTTFSVTKWLPTAH